MANCQIKKDYSCTAEEAYLKVLNQEAEEHRKVQWEYCRKIAELDKMIFNLKKENKSLKENLKFYQEEYHNLMETILDD